MSGSVDERIVKMTFDGASFLSGVEGAIKALSTLKSSLNGLKGSDSDLNDLNDAGKKFSLAGISSGLDGLSSKFGALKVAGLGALAEIGSKAAELGLSLLKSLTVDPIKAGLDSYETKINAIQTILANTSAEGTNLNQVTAALNQLNTYSNLTVFNFADMAKNIGTFTAAGVGLQTSVSSIKGIANLAALSGSSAEQASTGMYQLSQAIAAGSVKLQDWNSVVNAGFGGKVFQNALIETARVNGVAVDAMIKKYGSFRQSLQGGWLSAKVLTETLSEFTGDLSLSQLKAMGFTTAESEAIEKQAAIAVKSATQIRTISQLTAALSDDISTAYAGLFQAIIGDSQEAPVLLTAVFNAISGAVLTPINNLTKLVSAFRQLGGFDLIIQGVGEAVKAFGQVLGAIGDAFHDVFPANGGDAAQFLIKLAIGFQDLAEKMEPSKATLNDIKTIFTGVFSVVKLVVTVFSDLFGALGKVTSASTGAGNGLLGFLATLAKLVTKISDAVSNGTALKTFFDGLADVLSVPVKIISTLIGSLGGLGGAFDAVVKAVQPAIQKIGSAFSTLGDAIISGIKSGSFQNVANVINQGLIALILLKVKSFIAGLGSSTSSGLLDTIKESFEGLTNALKSMQQGLKAEILEKIAIAVALLAASLIALSFINVENLTKALTTITVLFGEMLTALSVITKLSGSIGIVKIVAVAVAIDLIAGAMVILAGAVAIFAQFSWTQLAKGLGSIAVLLGLLVTSTALLSEDSKGLIASAGSMDVMGVALVALARAVKILGALDITSLAKGIGGIAALMAILGVFNTFGGGEHLLSTAASMLVIGAALEVLTNVVIKLGAVPTDNLVKGLLSIAAALLIISVAMDTFPPDMIVTAASLLIVAAALQIMSGALTTMGDMSWSEIGKSMVELFGALTLISLAMIAMTEALPGAAALIVVAAALAILAPVLVTLGAQSWDSIAKGLVSLVGVFVILGAAGILLGPLVPVLLGLGVAIALIGAGVALAGVGVLAFATGLGALAIAVAGSGAAILSFVDSILSLIPLTFEKIGEGIVQFATAIGNGGAAIEGAFQTIFTAVLNGIIKVAPLAGQAFEAVLTQILNAINKDSPKIISTMEALFILVVTNMTKDAPKFTSAAAGLIVAVLNGINANIGKITTAATNMIVNFINAIGTGTAKVVSAGINMVITLINNIANKIRASSPQLDSATANLGSAIVEGLAKGVLSGVSSVISALVSVAESALSAAKKVLGIASPSKVFADEVGDQIPEGIAVGVVRSQSVATDAVAATGNALVDTLKTTLSGLSDVVNDNVDLQPKITPVVDLTGAKAGFDQLNSLSKSQLIAASASASSASSISAANAAAAAAAGLSASSAPSLTFNQYNTSPEALSATDIYRKTKNQLSIAKGALT
jgi:tape measure domain-containing protein